MTWRKSPTTSISMLRSSFASSWWSSTMKRHLRVLQSRQQARSIRPIIFLHLQLVAHGGFDVHFYQSYLVQYHEDEPWFALLDLRHMILSHRRGLNRTLTIWPLSHLLTRQRLMSLWRQKWPAIEFNVEFSENLEKKKFYLQNTLFNVRWACSSLVFVAVIDINTTQ